MSRMDRVLKSRLFNRHPKRCSLFVYQGRRRDSRKSCDPQFIKLLPPVLQASLESAIISPATRKKKSSCIAVKEITVACAVLAEAAGDLSRPRT
jgi:hypothetical protein